MDNSNIQYQIQSLYQQILDTKNQEAIDCDEFINKSLSIAKFLDENKSIEGITREREVRDCIAQSMPSIKEAITSISDIGKYEVESIPSFYNLNLYMKILEHLLDYYINTPEELIDKIKGHTIRCIDITETKVAELIIITQKEELLDMKKISDYFAKYNTDIEKFKHYISEKRIDSKVFDIDPKELLGEIRKDVVTLRTEVEKLDTNKIDEVRTKANNFYDKWEKSQAEGDAMNFIEKTPELLSGVMELGGLISKATGAPKEVQEVFAACEVFVGATLNIGISLIGCAASGGVGVIGVATSLIGGITSITNFFMNKDKESPEEIILQQIEYLGEKISNSFDKVFEYLNHMEQLVTEQFMEIKDHLDEIEKRMSGIKVTIDNIFSIILTKEYFSERNKGLTYHENFDNDMPYQMQVDGFYTFTNFATVTSVLESKHLRDGIDECIDGIINDGMDSYIPFLAEYANAYLAPINNLDDYITPRYWAQGCLDLVEFIFRTPEFKILKRQKETINEMIKLGNNVNNLCKTLFDNAILEKLILKYMDCLEDTLPNLLDFRLESIEESDPIQIDINKYANEVRSACSEMMDLDLFKKIKEYRTLIRAYFLLIHSIDYSGRGIKDSINALWGEDKFKSFLNDIYLETYTWETQRTIQKEYEELMKNHGKYKIEEQITLFLNNKYGIKKKFQNITEELRRNCRKLISYSKLNRKYIGNSLIMNVENYLMRFQNEFYNEELITKPEYIYKNGEIETLADYIFVDFGNILDYNSLKNFDDKDLGKIGDVNVSGKLQPWHVFDGSWYIEPSGEFSVIFDLNNTEKSVYLRLCNRFITMYNSKEDYLSQRIQVKLSNEKGIFPLDHEYRPQTFRENEFNHLTLLDNSSIPSKLSCGFFKEDIWKVPSDKLCKSDNKLIITTDGGYMIHSLEIATDVMTKPKEITYALYSEELDEYLGLEALELGNHRAILKKELDRTCHFVLKPMLFSNLYTLYSPYVHDIIVPTASDGFYWVDSFDLRPYNELVLDEKTHRIPEIINNRQLKLANKETENDVIAFQLPKFIQTQFWDKFISRGYICKGEGHTLKAFSAKDINKSKPIWFKLKEIK